MKFIKKITVAVLVAALFLSVAGCTDKPGGNAEETSAPPAKVAIRIATLKGPTGMGMARLMQVSENKTVTNDYTFAIESDPTVIGPKLIKGEVDIAACPLNMAAAIYNKTKGTPDKNDDIRLLAINTLGVLYILENGDTVTDFASLKGKTVYASGQGATPEYVLNYLLKANGLEPGKDVTVEYKTEHSELATLAVSGQASVVMLPEPFVTTVLSKNKDLRVALDMTAEWDKVEAAAGRDTTLAMGALVVKEQFAAQNPDAVKTFMKEYKASVDFVNRNPAEAATVIALKEIVPSPDLALRSIEKSKLTFIDSKEMKTIAQRNYEVLFEANAASVGGALPGDEFYYEG